ncbi:unnamed protein product [Phyllotreta striolata]|uniref:CHK kinase-like domain-containing protein n=1 Tax=Phyllotreta striolata TaxID=444603 RepID=A0A9N9TT67_PHYSR|nr:unnamed protein product [Phyllotreta striolata]
MNWSCKEIRKLDELLSGYLGNSATIKDVKTSQLSKPGENYGSIIYGLEITVENNENKTEETLHTIAKVLPHDELMRELFRVQTTYTNEMGFYKIIVPTVSEFQKELTGLTSYLDCFPKCFAARKNLLENNDRIDDDAVLLLENLKHRGFDNIDKRKGFDIETTKMVLRSLAQFHGVPLAIKIKKPNLFKEKLLPFCTDFYRQNGLMPQVIPLFKIITSEDPDVKEIVSKLERWEGAQRILLREPFSTLVHDDVWTNNTMQKFDSNGDPVANKMVDFQILSHGSPAIDLFFYLWTSVSLEHIKTHFDYFLEYYHEHLTQVLETYGIDTTPFSYEAFLDEIHAIGPFEMLHAFFFIVFAIHGREGGYSTAGLPDVSDINSTVPIEAKEKVWYMVKECYKRGWFRSL